MSLEFRGKQRNRENNYHLYSQRQKVVLFS